ncbi:MAG TPA: HAMP domain-containing sensor histidine kinase [Blastocatellia bacterium]|nr:HAMP domain-containing sensor histidine kinase [Blastocatellia bacterium]
MNTKRNKFWSGNNRFRLMLTLELAVMLPAAALIYVNFHHLESIKRDKTLEASIHRDFQYMLSVSEKKINDRIYTMAEEMRDVFPSPDADTEADRGRKLEIILSKNPWLAHVFLFDSEKGLLYRSQPQQMTDQCFREEHDRTSEMYRGWFGMEGKMLCDMMHNKTRAITCYGGQVKRADGGFMTTAFFTFPQLPKDRVVFGGVSFDPDYLKRTFFPEMFEELVAQKISEDRGNHLAMMVYPSEHEGDQGGGWLAASTGWGVGKPEVSRNLEDVFRGLTLGIKFQGTSADAIAGHLVQQSLLILGVLSLLMIGGLVLTYRSVSKEMALARLKSDFVSNVSHELRTPLSLIQLYAETLELGRITTQEKKDEYYRIIRKESERLGRLINNILDFSRIEAGRKEYELRETDIAELVRNTLDAYRYQIEKNGFEFEFSIDSNIPTVRVDREAIARALVNLVNNALKYSADEKFLVVRLYRANGVVKLEVVDRGIGIASRDQSKIFEKFYRTCDPLVHNTKGSGLGLSLVQHITHAHGGQVEVESTPGKGSKFTVSLPLPMDTRQPGNGMASGATA